MLASFPWYDLPSVQWANDCLWQATGYPFTLNRDRTVSELWHATDLLVTQACGLDLFLSDAPIEPVAAPVFDLDCEPGMYFSYIVGDINGSVAAVNSLSSRSGYSALLSICSPERVMVTGSHQASLAAIRAGHAAVAAIDAVTWHIISRDSPEEIKGLAIAGRSSPAPSPPFVTGRGVDRSTVFRSLRHGFDARSSMDAKKALYLKDIIAVQRYDYLSILEEYETVRGVLARSD